MDQSSVQPETVNTSMDIEAELNRFRHKLLDLSNINRLLNYRKSATKTVQIIDELPNQIFEQLVVKEKSFSFLAKTEDTKDDLGQKVPGGIMLPYAEVDSQEDSEEAGHELPGHPENDEVAKHHADDKLQTELTEKRIDRILNTMRQESNAAVEETGVNYLYFALGMLAWRERDGAERTFLAPLILVPVRLERSFDVRGNKYCTKIVYTGEDIQQNLSLAKRIENDFGLVLPEYQPDEDGNPMSPEDYFLAVGEAFAEKPEWKVCREALVGFFSFRKLLMYLDLDPKKWKGANSLKNHPIVRAVVEGTQIGDTPAFFAKDYDIDDYATARDISLVKDADSSQHSALCDISEGKSLVIEGPPGTGKSQTITNAIADALSDGKSVLFVAEKLAALEVVRNSLEKVGLGAFCLELHSEAANPRDVFADLARRLDSQFPSTHEVESLHERAEAQKKKLKLYLHACQLPAGPHDRPLYEVFWRIVELRSRGIEILPNAQVDTTIDELLFDDAIARLNEVAAYVKELGPPLERPWHGFFANKLPPSGHRTVANIIDGLLVTALAISDSSTVLADRFGGKPSDWITLAYNINEESLGLIKPPEDFDRTLIPFLKNSQVCVMADTIAAEVDDARLAREQSAELIVRDLGDSREAAEEVAHRLAKKVPKPLHTCSLQELRELRSQVLTTLQAIEVFQRIASQLHDLRFGKIQTLRDFEQSCFKYRLVSHEAVAPPNVLQESLFFSNAANAFHRGRKTCSQLLKTQEALEQQVYLAKIPGNDEIEEMIDTLQAYGQMWSRFFRSHYRKCRKEIKFFRRPSARKVTCSDWVTILRKIRDYRVSSLKYSEDAELHRVFEETFQGLETDWKSAETSLRWTSMAKKSGLGYQQASSLVALRWTQSNAPSEGDVLAAGKLLRQELQQEQICLALGINIEAFDVFSVVKIRDILVELSGLLEGVERCHQSFATRYTVPFEDFIDEASLVLKTLDRIETLDNHKEFRTAFPEHFAGIHTELKELCTTAAWTKSLHEMQIAVSAINTIAADDTGKEAHDLFTHLQSLREECMQWSEQRDTLSQFGIVDKHWLSLPGPEDDPCRLQRLNVLKHDAAHLPPWAGLCRALERCQSQSLDEFSQAIYEGRLEATVAGECYDLTLHEQLAATILDGSEPLRTFSRQGADRTRREFQQLDRQLIEANQSAIAHAASKRHVPVGVSTGRVGQLTELGLIRHETGKQRRFCRIRDLILRAGRAVQGLKPCFMMSPLSIAQYLPAGSLEFDLVVMDEASQIKPEDALGTLIRAKQLVVVGDPKQLPPTSFFDRISESDEDEESTFLDDTESILEVALKAFPNKRRLRWHYRSQHESLIAFSNEKFYDGELVVFPSPTTAAGRLGLRWHHVEDAFFTGGCNPIEANVVAEAIAHHAIEHPDETLGIATFNVKQAQAIRDRLDELASNDSHVRLALERFQDHTDRLFVKNLENVQGDERDVIFISYTYGPDPATKVVMNRFGPMTGQHGWRRLNVLITRAKRRVEVFSSMKPSDIKGGPERSRGVNSMKDYLQYAMTGQLVDRGSFSDREPDSPFEIAVARVIEGLGLKVVPQVGVAGYFVDLGILKPDSVGEFLLGVECDGATYHSSKSARDRDRLREEVITLRGWKLHRIWSTDWFMNQAAEEERLRDTITAQLSRQEHC